jgi:hypothetical protein
MMLHSKTLRLTPDWPNPRGESPLRLGFPVTTAMKYVWLDVDPVCLPSEQVAWPSDLLHDVGS